MNLIDHLEVGRYFPRLLCMDVCNYRENRNLQVACGSFPPSSWQTDNKLLGGVERNRICGVFIGSAANHRANSPGEVFSDL